MRAPLQKSGDGRGRAVFDTRLIAFYLPQFHPIPENDAWWGKDFTEWTNVVRARPNFTGHYQPHVPAELGYYDLRKPDVRARQAALARGYGIHGFCYYYYWFGGRKLLNRPLDEVVTSGEPDLPFCICWANENWSRRWDGGNNELLIAQTYSPENERRLLEDLVPLLADPRYIRIAGKPLLLVYRANLLPDARRATDTFRRVAREAGIGELHLAFVEQPGTPAPQEWGFDAAVEFPPQGFEVTPLTESIDKINPAFVGEVWDYISAARHALARTLPAWPLYRGVMAGWDNTPRLQNNGQIFVNSHPDNYRRWLSEIVQQGRGSRAPNERVVFINAWNEWGEGCHLEPDERFGRAFLEATLAALQDNPSPAR